MGPCPCHPSCCHPSCPRGQAEYVDRSQRCIARIPYRQSSRFPIGRHRFGTDHSGGKQSQGPGNPPSPPPGARAPETAARDHPSPVDFLHCGKFRRGLPHRYRPHQGRATSCWASSPSSGTATVHTATASVSIRPPLLRVYLYIWDWCTPASHKRCRWASNRSLSAVPPRSPRPRLAQGLSRACTTCPPDHARLRNIAWDSRATPSAL